MLQRTAVRKNRQRSDKTAERDGCKIKDNVQAGNVQERCMQYGNAPFAYIGNSGLRGRGVEMPKAFFKERYC